MMNKSPYIDLHTGLRLDKEYYPGLKATRTGH